MTEDDALRQRAVAVVNAFGTQLKTSPESMPAMISAYEALNAQRRQVAIVGTPGNSATDALTSLYWRDYLPHAILLHAVAGLPQRQLSKSLPLVATLQMRDGKATAYVCRNYACNAYVKVSGRWKYLFRAVDKHGRLIDFMLADRRNTRAAHRFWARH